MFFLYYKEAFTPFKVRYRNTVTKVYKELCINKKFRILQIDITLFFLIKPTTFFILDLCIIILYKFKFRRVLYTLRKSYKLLILFYFNKFINDYLLIIFIYYKQRTKRAVFKFFQHRKVLFLRICYSSKSFGFAFSTKK